MHATIYSEPRSTRHDPLFCLDLFNHFLDHMILILNGISCEAFNLSAEKFLSFKIVSVFELTQFTGNMP